MGEIMTIENYRLSADIEQMPFEAIIMAYMRGADDVALKFLKNKHPSIWKELKERYNAPGGKLKGEI